MMGDHSDHGNCEGERYSLLVFVTCNKDMIPC